MKANGVLGLMLNVVLLFPIFQIFDFLNEKKPHCVKLSIISLNLAHLKHLCYVQIVIVLKNDHCVPVQHSTNMKTNKNLL